MRIHAAMYAIIVSITIITSAASISTMGGCRPSQTMKAADKSAALSIDLGTAADKIRTYVDRYDLGELDNEGLVGLIISALPEGWSEKFNRALVVYDDVRIAATTIADALDISAVDAAESAVKLREQAQSESNGWDNFLAIGAEVIGGVMNPQGVIASGLALIALHLRRKKNKAEQQAVASQNTAIQMRDVAESITYSMEAFKATPQGRAAWDQIGRGVVANAQSRRAQGFVDEVKSHKAVVRSPDTIGDGTSTAKPYSDPSVRSAAVPPITAPTVPGTPDAPGPDQYDPQTGAARG